MSNADAPSCAEKVSVSVVVPVYSGGEYLRMLITELELVRNGWMQKDCPISLIEVVLTDDAAIDASPEIADTISAEYDWVTVVHLARNFGQHPATIAGILHTSGDWIVTLDEDLQHPPTKIEDMLRTAVLSGSDVIYANADAPVHQSYLRDISSRLYKSVIGLMSGNRNIHAFNSFRLIRGSVARAASSVCGHDTYFDVSLSWFTQRVEIVRMKLIDERFIRNRKSGYSFLRLISHARKMLMSSGPRVMRAASILGLAIITASATGAGLMVLYEFFGNETDFVKGWSSLFVAVVLLGGVIIFLIGIILEYLALLVMSAHGKPIFFTIDRGSDRILLDYFRKRSL